MREKHNILIIFTRSGTAKQLQTIHVSKGLSINYKSDWPIKFRVAYHLTGNFIQSGKIAITPTPYHNCNLDMPTDNKEDWRNGHIYSKVVASLTLLLNLVMDIQTETSTTYHM